MQNELVYEIAGEFCETLCRLLSEHPPQSSDPVSALRKLSPDWHLQLPLVLPEANAAEIVRRLLSQSSEIRSASSLQVERIWSMLMTVGIVMPGSDSRPQCVQNS